MCSSSCPYARVSVLSDFLTSSTFFFQGISAFSQQFPFCVRSKILFQCITVLLSYVMDQFKEEKHICNLYGFNTAIVFESMK